MDVTLAGHKVRDKISNWCYLDIPSLSDHPFIRFDLEICPQTTSKAQFLLPNLEFIDSNVFGALLSATLPYQTPPQSRQQIDIAIQSLTSAIQKAALCKTVRLPRPSNKTVYWWTADLSKLRAQLRKAQKASNKRPCSLNLETTADFKRRYKSLIRTTRAEAFKTFCSKETGIELFKSLRKLSGAERSFRNVPALKNSEGTLTNNDSEILSIFHEHFFPQGNQSPNVAIFDLKESTSDVPSLSEHEVREAVFEIKSKSTPGLDGITAGYLQKYYSVIQRNLFNILAACIQIQYFPLVWKRSLVIIIPKSGKSDYESVSSFRPISLLSTFGKVFEKILLRRLQYFSNQHDWFNCRQHGFRSNCLTISALHEVVSKIEYGFSQKAHTGSLFLDIKGAFDNVTHAGISDCLKRKECPIYLLNLIQGFLSERTATLQLNDKIEICEVHKSCPQGSPLSPFLWNVACDELLSKKLPRGVHIQGFADDISLMKTGVAVESIQIPLQQAADIVIEWANSHQLEISADKTELIVFSRRRRLVVDVVININGTLIREVTQVNHLGLILDQTLSWHAHIVAKCSKAKQSIFNLRRLSKLTWGSNTNILSRLYQAIIEPILLYGCSIWVSALRRQSTVSNLRSV